MGPDARFPQFFSFTFDASVADLFLTWGAGATLVVPGPRDLVDPIGYIGRGRLTHWFSVPSSVRTAEMLDTLQPGAAEGLRHSMFGAEPLTHKQMTAWRQAAPHSTIWNMYGPTETTVTCIVQRFDGDAATWPTASNGTLPLGRPYAGTEVRLLDPDGRAAEDGEICIRGEQRFDGYLDPADDRGRFAAFEPGGVATTIHGRPRPGHWYRTGDRGRMEGGFLVHHGRLDQQVKVRGHRVEIGDVEAAIHTHLEVADAAVVLVPRDDGDELVGYYVAEKVDPPALGSWLLGTLPDYMVPGRLVELPALPLNDNGKIDRRLLVELAKGHTAVGATIGRR